MKNINQQPSKPTRVNAGNKRRPENKDDLDSREGQKQLMKGDHITHKKKEKQNRKRTIK